MLPAQASDVFRCRRELPADRVRLRADVFRQAADYERFLAADNYPAAKDFVGRTI
jgi:hypothetical protein